MAQRKVSVELLYSKGCSKCAEAREELRSAAQSAGPVDWKEVDVAQHPNRAVELGVVSTPALAINGELVFPSMPSPSELRKAIRTTLGGR